MIENLGERGPGLRHSSGSGLAKANAVAFTCSFKHDARRIFVNREIIAGNGIPADTSIDVKARGLSAFAQIHINQICQR